jgi:hypothetical protein
LQNFADGRGTAESAANRQTTPQLIKNYTHRAAQSSERIIAARILSQWFFGPIIKRVDTVITAIPLCSAAAISSSRFGSVFYLVASKLTRTER